MRERGKKKERDRRKERERGNIMVPFYKLASKLFPGLVWAELSDSLLMDKVEAFLFLLIFS